MPRFDPLVLFLALVLCIGVCNAAHLRKMQPLQNNDEQAWSRGYADGYPKGYAAGCRSAIETAPAAFAATVQPTTQSKYQEGFDAGYSKGFEKGKNDPRCGGGMVGAARAMRRTSDDTEFIRGYNTGRRDGYEAGLMFCYRQMAMSQQTFAPGPFAQGYEKGYPVGFAAGKSDCYYPTTVPYRTRRR